MSNTRKKFGGNAEIENWLSVRREKIEILRGNGLGPGGVVRDPQDAVQYDEWNDGVSAAFRAQAAHRLARTKMRSPGEPTRPHIGHLNPRP